MPAFDVGKSVSRIGAQAEGVRLAKLAVLEDASPLPMSGLQPAFRSIYRSPGRDDLYERLTFDFRSAMALALSAVN